MNSVAIVETQGTWHVRVVENGASDIVSFEIESFASAFAEGQRIRLDLEGVTRF